MLNIPNNINKIVLKKDNKRNTAIHALGVIVIDEYYFCAKKSF